MYVNIRPEDTRAIPELQLNLITYHSLLFFISLLFLFAKGYICLLEARGSVVG
jgi:hypothetical protein